MSVFSEQKWGVPLGMVLTAPMDPNMLPLCLRDLASRSGVWRPQESSATRPNLRCMKCDLSLLGGRSL
jgi:hypothetical protein